MKRVVFARPSYNAVIDEKVEDSHLLAIMHGAKHGALEWAGVATPRRLGWASARNVIFKLALKIEKEVGLDGICWVDDDVVIPQETFSRLVSRDFDFVSGLYFQKIPPHWPVVGMWNGKLFHFASSYVPNTLMAADAIGFGCCYTSMDLLKKVAELPESKGNGSPGAGPFGGDFHGEAFGEDFLFCLRAAKVGIRPFVDTGLRCKHGPYGYKYAEEADFLKYQPNLMKGPGDQEWLTQPTATQESELPQSS